MSFFRPLFRMNNVRSPARSAAEQTNQPINVNSIRDLTSYSAALLNQVLSQVFPKPLTPEELTEITQEIYEESFHKHTIPLKEGRLVLLWKEKTTYQEYLDLLTKISEERTIDPSYAIQTNLLTGRQNAVLDVISPFVIPDVKDVVYSGWKYTDMDLLMKKTIELFYLNNFVIYGVDISLKVSDEDFYFIYEGVGKLRVSENQTKHLKRLGEPKFTDIYKIEFKSDTEGNIYARTEYANSLLLKSKDIVIKLLMFKFWLVNINGFGLKSLWIFLFLIFFYGFGHTLLFVIGFVIFRDHLKNTQFRSEARRRFVTQQRDSRRNVEGLFKEMVYVSTQEIAY